MTRLAIGLLVVGALLTVSAGSSDAAGPLPPAPVATSGPSAAPLSRGEAASVAVKPAAYAPLFTAAKTEFGHYWIQDHGRRMALFGFFAQDSANYTIGLFRQFPGQELDENKIKDSEVLEFVSLPGLKLATSWIGAPAMKGVPGEMKLDSNDPTQLTIHLSWKKSAEEFGTQVLRVAYDQDLARYVVHVEDNLQIKEPGGGEYCNFYANGLGDFRPWVGRYDRLLYQDADDGNKLKAHYLSDRASKPTPGLIHLPATNGLIGYADEKDGNPVVIVEETTPDTHVGICACWYDSHLTWDTIAHAHGARTPDVAGPPYRYHARLKAYWNSPAETGALLATAQTVSLAPFADNFKNCYPIDMNIVNNFEHNADFLAGKVKHIYFTLPPMKPSGGITHDTTIGRSGHDSSICFIAKTDKGIRQGLDGPELMVTPGRQVKISAWIKTADVTGEGFYLESGFEHFTPAGHEQIGPMYQSAKLTGTNDWTLLEIPLPVTPPGALFLKGRVAFHLAGKGTAWMDDFVFAEQDANGPPAGAPNAPAKP